MPRKPTAGARQDPLIPRPDNEINDSALTTQPVQTTPLTVPLTDEFASPQTGNAITRHEEPLPDEKRPFGSIPEFIERLARDGAPSEQDPPVADSVSDSTDSTDGLYRQEVEALLGTQLHQVDEGIILDDSASISAEILIIVRGNVCIQAEAGATLIELAPGDPVGALELWTGRSWPIVAKAQTNCEYFTVPARDFRQMLLQNRSLRRYVGESVTNLMRQIRLYELLASTLSQLPDALLALVQNKALWRHLDSGEQLFAQDDVVESLFLVVSGRLRQIRISLDGTETEVGHVESGEMIGTFFGSLQMPAKSLAVRETVLLELPAELRKMLGDEFPQLIMPFLQSASSRERSILDALDKPTASPTTFAIIPATADVKLSEFAYELALAVAHHGSVRPITRADVDAHYRQNQVADIPRHHPMHSLLLDWLQQLESNHDYMFYIGDAAWSEWTQRCIRQADRVLVVAKTTNSSDPSMTEQAIFETVTHAEVDLVLLHSTETSEPSGTAEWLDARAVHTHYHVRRDAPTHYARLARRLTGNAIGIVLAGGGARGCAHVGLLRALEEQRIPYDYVGGTSIGALIGAAFGLGWNSSYTLQQVALFSNRKALFDFTLPVVSLFASDKVTELMRRQFGGYQIEDLWYPYFGISTNLTSGSMMIHDRGPLWFAVRASLSIPAVFTPVVNEDGHLLVDGGVMNNFPVDVMQQRLKGGRIIGVRLQVEEEDDQVYDPDLSVSGWQVLRRRLNPTQESPNVPHVGTILFRSMMVNDQQAMQRADQMCDLLLKPDVDSFGLLQFERYAEIFDVGYKTASEANLLSIMP